MKTLTKRYQSFPLRLSPTVRDHAREIAQREGLSLNHFVSLAIAEKLSRIEHEHWLKRGSPILKKGGMPAQAGPVLQPKVQRG